MTTNDRKTEIKRAIEIADRVLRETPMGRYPRDELWLVGERARLADELRELETTARGA
jgi:hypothetical protein